MAEVWYSGVENMSAKTVPCRLCGKRFDSYSQAGDHIVNGECGY